mgnify:CR=1 FL=1|tara:strand:+ start:4595 stop:6034 length:1440 start_codon:yes stop_codon:yes gene_type:complete
MLKLSQQTRLSQKQKMSPQMQQNIGLLLLPALDLKELIESSLNENIMLETDSLELDESNDLANISEPLLKDGEILQTENEITLDDTQIGSAVEWAHDNTIGESDKPKNLELPDNYNEVADPAGKTLKDHLLWQLEMERLGSREAIIGQVIIDSIDEDGYLKLSTKNLIEILLPEIVSNEAEIEKIINGIQAFEPSGIAARTLSECILLQLEEIDPSTPELTLAQTIARELDSVPMPAELNKTLKKNLQISNNDLEAAWLLIQSCNRQPGLLINSSEPDYIIPDVYAKKNDKGWFVELNTSDIPKIKINDQYLGLLEKKESFSPANKMLEEAKWLIRGLEQREITIDKVAKAIIKKQENFLDYGEEHMQPMIMSDIAHEIGMHESTISRITNNKYMHTPRGIFELKFFFSSSIGTSEGKKSSVSVKAKIRKLISTENLASPLSDEKITALLIKDGINVKRRTVAKYRESMNIPSSSKRKM